MSLENLLNKLLKEGKIKRQDTDINLKETEPSINLLTFYLKVKQKGY